MSSPFESPFGSPTASEYETPGHPTPLRAASHSEHPSLDAGDYDFDIGSDPAVD